MPAPSMGLSSEQLLEQAMADRNTAVDLLVDLLHVMPSQVEPIVDHIIFSSANQMAAAVRLAREMVAERVMEKES